MASNRGLQDIQNLIDVIFKYLIVVHSVIISTNFNIFPGGSRAGYAQLLAVSAVFSAGFLL
jgi:hypothetical protein